MSVNRNEINIPINPEKRDPFYGRSKSEIGLGLTPNMSYSDIETSILANVKSTINEGVVYNFDKFGSDSDPILSNLVKLKPNSSITTIHFSIGTWTSNSEFISRDTATLELRSTRTNVSYNLFISEPYPNNIKTPLSSTKIVFKEFNSGGWLVSIKITDRQIDSIWVNFVESRNIDIQNPLEDAYSSDDFGRSFEILCDKSRISTNLGIGNLDVVAKSLSHPVPIKLESVDPKDYYNSQSKSYSLTNLDLSDVIGTPSQIKGNSLISIPILTDEDTCKSDQLIPMSVNRLNHPIKFRLFGNCLHEEQSTSWRESQSNQLNLTSFLDTDLNVINEYPLSISELTHDLCISISKSEYYGSNPESGESGGSGYGRYEFDGGKVNYATLGSSSSSRNEYYKYDSDMRRWSFMSEYNEPVDKSGLISTKNGLISELNLIIHGLDHDLKIEAVNSEYRLSRGKATDENNLYNDKRKINSGIRNLTWEEYSGVDNEDRVNSYVTGLININTFEKDIYQCMDLTVHGLDHNINLSFYRVDCNVLKGPNDLLVQESDKYRINSNGKDIFGDINIDTFTKRVQNSKLEIIDSRYSDCSRGLAIMRDGNFIPWDEIDNLGEYGNYTPENPSSSEILKIYPTINGIPFTGDFRHKIKYPSDLESDKVSKIHDARNITIPAYHKDSSLNGSGGHKWEVLESVRLAKYDESNLPISVISDNLSLDSELNVSKGYGLTRLTEFDNSISSNSMLSPSEKFSRFLDSLSDDDDVISVKAVREIINIIGERFEKLERNVSVD